MKTKRKTKCFSFSVYYVGIYFLLFISINDDGSRLVVGDGGTSSNCPISTTSQNGNNSNGGTETFTNRSSGSKGNDRILSRRRRYLIFPEGSSLQLVYDTYHPIVDYANLLIVGITAALAWELPNTPVYLEEELQEAYENGNLPFLDRRNDIIVDYPNNTQSSNENIDNWNNKQYSSTNNSINVYQSTNVNNRKNYKTLTTNVEIVSDKIQKKVPKAKWKTNSYRNRYNRLIHPLLRRRSPQNSMNKREIFEQNYHRNSRYELFEIVGKFIETKFSVSGVQCNLKALCESGQRTANDEPGSFMVELLRAFYSLPYSIDNPTNLLQRQYDKAHFTEGSCEELYSNCNFSIFNF